MTKTAVKNSFNSGNLLVLNDKKFEKEFLGRTLWYTISELKINYEELQEAFQNAGIDEKYLPKPISPRDAFRRATKIAEAKRVKLDEDKYLNLLVREVKQTDDEIIRQLVREVVDSKNVRLEYLPVANMRLENDTTFITEPIIDSRRLYNDESVALLKAENEFDHCKDNYNGRHVREVVQNILSGCEPVALRPSGGVYFVPEKYNATVQALSEMIKEISAHSVNTDRSRFYSLPVIDAQEHREMVTESLEDQVKNQSESLIAEMAKALKTGKTITQKLAEQYITRVRELRESVKKYEDTLQTEIIGTQSIMDIAMKQARAMLDKVDAA